jgi:hypothetical protein
MMSRAAAGERTASMYRFYFVKRLLEAIELADHAHSSQEREVYLRTARYYHDLIGSSGRH